MQVTRNASDSFLLSDNLLVKCRPMCKTHRLSFCQSVQTTKLLFITFLYADFCRLTVQCHVPSHYTYVLPMLFDLDLIIKQ